MKVLKFGGTSVGKPERMHSIAQLISGSERKLVVLSAVSGTTNALVEISNALLGGKKDKGNELIEKLFQPYHPFVNELYKSEEGLKKGKAIIEAHYNFIKSHTTGNFTEASTRILLAEGELISTQLFQE
ncbi:MAG TPA: aspartate kinase, partial [Cytophagaceae bacterium]